MLIHTQALSTGIHLETAAECARRELKEECGIALKLPDVEKAEKVVHSLLKMIIYRYIIVNHPLNK